MRQVIPLAMSVVALALCACDGEVATGCFPEGCERTLSCDNPDCNIDADGDGSSHILDCDDDDAEVFPGAVELCGNHRDDDCDNTAICDGGTEDVDGDDYGAQASGGTDCDDGDPTIHPGVTEVCEDGVDDDCDASLICDGGTVDEDGDEYGSTATGGTDCADTDAAIKPSAPELCNGNVDDDCDGSAICDGGLIDDDSDGFGSVTTGGSDCDDTSDLVRPGAAEDCGTPELESCGTRACTDEFVRFPLDSAAASALLGITTNTWLLGTRDGRLYRSTSGGASWGPARELDPGRVSRMMVASDGTVVVGLRRFDTAPTGVWTSDNDGASFSSAGDLTGLNGGEVTDLAPAAGDPFGVWATTAGGGLYLSSDGAATFTQIGTGVIDPFAYAVASDPNDFDNVVVATDTAVYRSTNAGGDFAATIDPLPAPQPFADASLVVVQDRLYFLLDVGGMKVSPDFGATWIDFGRSSNVLKPRDLAMAMDGDIAVASHDLGAVVSLDGGAVWEPVAAATGVELDRVAPIGGLWLLAGRRGVFGVGGGITRRLQGGLDGLDARHVAAAGTNEILVAGGDGTLFQSTDGGISFAALPSPVRTLVAATRAGTTLVAISDDGRILHWRDGAFAQVANQSALVTAFAFDGTTLALATGEMQSQVVVGTVGCDTCVDLTPETGVPAALVDALMWRSGGLFVGARDGSLVSRSNSETELTPVTTPPTGGPISSLFSGLGLPVYATVGGPTGGLFRSDDDGDTFAPVGTDTGSTFVRAGCVDATSGTVAIVADDAIYLSSDQGETWDSALGPPAGVHNNPLPVATGCRFRETTDETTLWVTTRDRGVWITRLP